MGVTELAAQEGLQPSSSSPAPPPEAPLHVLIGFTRSPRPHRVRRKPPADDNYPASKLRVLTFCAPNPSECRKIG